MGQMTPQPVVAEAERLLAAGCLQKDVARYLDISKDTVRKIKRRQHVYSTASLRALPGRHE